MPSPAPASVGAPSLRRGGSAVPSSGSIVDDGALGPLRSLLRRHASHASRCGSHPARLAESRDRLLRSREEEGRLDALWEEEEDDDDESSERGLEDSIATVVREAAKARGAMPSTGSGPPTTSSDAEQGQGQDQDVVRRVSLDDEDDDDGGDRARDDRRRPSSSSGASPARASSSSSSLNRDSRRERSFDSSRSDDVDSTNPPFDPLEALTWRSKMAGWFHTFVLQRGYAADTALVALAYLDAWAGQLCFEGGEDEGAVVAEDAQPSPPKKRKILLRGSNASRSDRSRRGSGGGGGHSRRVRSEEYVLAAVSSLYLACKVHESGPGTLSSLDFSIFCRGKQYSAARIEEGELAVLAAIDHRVHVPTALRFVVELMPLLLDSDSREGSSYARDSRPWTPTDGLRKAIYDDACRLATSASLGGGGTDCGGRDFPSALLSAGPPIVALASVAEAADSVFYRYKLIAAQNDFHQRLFALKEIPYDEEVMAVQARLRDLEGSGRRGSGLEAVEGPSGPSRRSSLRRGRGLERMGSAADVQDVDREKENRRFIRVALPESSKSHKAKQVPSHAASRAAVHRAVKSAAKNRAEKSTCKSRCSRAKAKCPGGSNHRTWEGTEPDVLAATKPSRFAKCFGGNAP